MENLSPTLKKFDLWGGEVRCRESKMEKGCQESRLLADSDSVQRALRSTSSPRSAFPSSYDGIIHNRATHLLAGPRPTVEAITKPSKGDQESGAIHE